MPTLEKPVLFDVTEPLSAWFLFQWLFPLEKPVLFDVTEPFTSEITTYFFKLEKPVLFDVTERTPRIEVECRMLEKPVLFDVTEHI